MASDTMISIPAKRFEQLLEAEKEYIRLRDIERSYQSKVAFIANCLTRGHGKQARKAWNELKDGVVKG